jgi:hypothetical protein
MAHDAVAEIVTPQEIGRGSIGAVLEPGKKAAEPPDCDRSREWRGETEPSRAGDPAAPLHDLDREDGASKPAEDALADLVEAPLSSKLAVPAAIAPAIIPNAATPR